MKYSLDGAQRAIPPEETLRRIRPFFKDAGISRIADITDLDYIGIPVTLCIRPDSATLAVDSGKGATLVAAMASAAMEGMERWIAERTDVSYSLEECRNLVTEFPKYKGAVINDRKKIKATEVRTFDGESKYLVPRSCVTFDLDHGEPISEKIFYNTSNGLSAGNTLVEALVSGIYEVIERDATHLAGYGTTMGKHIPKIRTSTIADEHAISLIEKVRKANCDVILLDATSDIGVHTVICYLFDRDNIGSNGYAKGYGTHLSPGVAICRSICEACQGRLVHIAGSRDDLGQAQHAFITQSAKLTNYGLFLEQPETVDYHSMHDYSCDTFEGDLKFLEKLLDSAGISRPLYYQMDNGERSGANVVRVLIPGLEGYLTPWVEIGNRCLMLHGCK